MMRFLRPLAFRAKPVPATRGPLPAVGAIIDAWDPSVHAVVSVRAAR